MVLFSFYAFFIDFIVRINIYSTGRISRMTYVYIKYTGAIWNERELYWDFEQMKKRPTEKYLPQKRAVDQFYNIQTRW